MRKRKILLSVVSPILFMLFLMPLPGKALENDECQECHSDDTLERSDSSGMKELLFVDTNRFKYSVHNVNGIACIDCHADISELDMDSDVPHSVELAKVVCENCHEEIGEAYSNSVHKKAGRKGVTIACYACHEYHYTTPLAIASVADRQNNFCRKCHDPGKFHEWLPQKETHFDFVECTVCHAPETPRHVNLQIFDLVQDRFLETDEMLRLLGTDFAGFMALLDSDKNEIIDSEELFDLVLLLRRWGVRATFHGEMVADIEPSVHQVNRGAASSECSQCHSIDSPFFQDVRLMLSRSDGTIQFHQVDRQVIGTYHVEFNALGSARLRLLDQIGLLLVVGGFLFVFCHLSVRLLTIPLRRKKQQNDDQGEV